MTAGRQPPPCCPCAEPAGGQFARRLGPAAQHLGADTAPPCPLVRTGPLHESLGRQHAAALLREVAQVGRLVDRIADHRVLATALRTDAAGHGGAAGDADAGLQARNLVPEPLALGQPLRHLVDEAEHGDAGGEAPHDDEPQRRAHPDRRRPPAARHATAPGSTDAA